MIVDYSKERDHSLIHIFTEGQHITKKFIPYFYNPTNHNTGNLPELITKDGYGQKIEVLHPTDVYNAKQQNSYESDVLFPHRFILDKVQEINSDYSYICFDIEIHSEKLIQAINAKVLENPEIDKRSLINKGLAPIISIAAIYKIPWKNIEYSKIYYLNPVKGAPLSIDCSADEIIVFDNEIKLLQHFRDDWHKYDIDLVTGWGIDNFDIPYLMYRCEKLGLPRLFGRFRKEVNFPTFGRKFFQIWGRGIMDANTMYKSIRPKQLRSTRLQYVSKKEKLQRPKFELPGKGSNRFTDVWINNPSTFAEYNLYDVFSASELFERDLPHFKRIQQIIFQQIDKTMTANSVAGSILLRLARQKNKILPSGHGEDPSWPILKGAEVFDPVVGFFDQVTVWDYISYYPNLIRTFNLSAETEVKNSGCQLFNGYCFDQTEMGILVEATNSILPERFKQKRLMKQYQPGTLQYQYHNEIQIALKHVVDSFYGATKNVHFRMRSLAVASTILWLSREGIKYLKSYLENQGVNVIRGDTDSCFGTEGKDPNSIIDEFDFMKFIPKICIGDMPKTNYVEIGIDKVFEPFYSLGEKKRYFGLVDGKLKSSGFGRADEPLFADRLRQKIFVEILEGNGRFPQESYSHLKKEFMEVDLDKIGFPMAFPGGTDFKRAVQYGESFLGLTFMPFDRPLGFKMQSTGGYPHTSLIVVNDINDIPSSFKIDRNAMWERMIGESLGNTLKSQIQHYASVL